jgi:murein DD-endopeptidase MepM/ murein hydrolase activator NlpD
VVREGDQVKTGDLLGYCGHTGFAAGPHLHFVVYRAVDAYHREGYPIVFRVDGQDQPVILEQGRSYAAP